MSAEGKQIMGDIGKPIRHIELEPFTTPAPVEPDRVPVPEPEKVPA